jgi:hypothetical protein
MHSLSPSYGEPDHFQVSVLQDSIPTAVNLVFVGAYTFSEVFGNQVMYLFRPLNEYGILGETLAMLYAIGTSKHPSGASKNNFVLIKEGTIWEAFNRYNPGAVEVTDRDVLAWVNDLSKTDLSNVYEPESQPIDLRSLFKRMRSSRSDLL